jgi:hypothetical protein
VSVPHADTITTMEAADLPPLSEEATESPSPKAGPPADGRDGRQESGGGVVVESGSGGPLPVAEHLDDNVVRELISRQTLDEVAEADQRLAHA